MITVYHNPQFTELFFSRKNNLRKEYFCKSEKVAEVDTDNLDVAYEKTNHIDSLWFSNKEVIVFKKSRSTSVGDFLEKDGELYIVEMVGFQKIN